MKKASTSQYNPMPSPSYRDSTTSQGMKEARDKLFKMAYRLGMEDPDDEDKVSLSTVEDWIVDQLARRLPMDDLFNLQMRRVYEMQSNANLEVKLRRKPDRKSTRLNSSHSQSRMPSSA